MADLIIDDSNYRDFLQGGQFDDGFAYGLVPRDMDRYPVGSFGAPTWTLDGMDLIPQSEWSDRIKEMEATKSRISDLRAIGDQGKLWENLDQNGQGYCWAYSTTHTLMLARSIMGLPYVRLSAHAIGCKVKGFRDQGGWSAQSMQYIAEHGVPDVAHWKEKSMARTNDTADTWANAESFKITSGWVELDAPVYDRDMSFAQVMTCLLNRVPVAGDFNWWGHAIALMDPVEVERGSFGIRILNSWRGWGVNGTAVLRGSKAIPDNAVAPRAIVSKAA